MTNDLNDHFLGGRGKRETPGGRGNEKPPGVPALKYAGTTGGAPERTGDLRWNRRERGPRGTGGTGGRREREKKLELKNLGTSAGYGYLPVAQARY